jgi:hypothetical protein
MIKKIPVKEKLSILNSTAGFGPFTSMIFPEYALRKKVETYCRLMTSPATIRLNPKLLLMKIGRTDKDKPMMKYPTNVKHTYDIKDKLTFSDRLTKLSMLKKLRGKVTL